MTPSLGCLKVVWGTLLNSCHNERYEWWYVGLCACVELQKCVGAFPKKEGKPCWGFISRKEERIWQTDLSEHSLHGMHVSYLPLPLFVRGLLIRACL